MFLQTTPLGIRCLPVLLLMTLSLSLVGQINTPSGAAIPFGSNTSYPGSGIMPTNLPTTGAYGASQDATDAYLDWKNSYVESCGGNNPERFRVKFDNTSETVSEGIAYGMLLAAYAADQELFDGLWDYYKNFSNNNGVMNWKINGCSGIQGTGGATDAELDAAMALLVADHQWPNTTTPHDYQADVTALIDAIKTYEIQPTNQNGPYQTNNGDGWGFGNNCRNPSYQSPAYYKVYAEFNSSQNAFWTECTNASYALLNANAHATTGLVSNWSDHTGAPNSCNGANDYGWDACRNPWRMGTDVLWYSDANAAALCDKMADWMQGVGVNNLKAPLPQNGTGGSYVNPAFISTWAVGVMGANSSYQSLLNEMYTKTVNTYTQPPSGYFGNTLRVVGLFCLSGNFWNPFNTGGSNNNAPTASFTLDPSSGTAPLAISFDASASSDPDGDPLTYSWNFGDGDTANGQVVNHTYTTVGSFTAVLIVNDGNGGNDTHSATVTVNGSGGNNPPTASFILTPSAGTAPLAVSFDASASSDPDGDPLTYSWDFGDGNSGSGSVVSHTYTATGSFTTVLTLDDGNGGTDTHNATVTVNNGNGPCDLVLQYRTFDNTQSSATDNQIRPHFKINNEENTSISLSDLTIRYWYTKEGTNGETVHVDWAQMGSQNIVTNIIQMASPTTGADHYLEVGFTAGAGSIPANGTSGQVQTRFHKNNWSNYDETDDYSYDMSFNTFQNWDKVTLYCNGLLTYGTEPGSSNPNNPPTADFSLTPSSGTAPLAVSFDASASTDPDGDPLTYSWDFGDGNSGSGFVVSHTYTTAVTFTAVLTVDDGNDGTGTHSATVTVSSNPPTNNPPTADFSLTPSSGTAPLAVSFDASASTDPDGDPLTYSWDFGDGNSGSGVTVSHTYTTAGTFTAVLTVDDGNGGTDTHSANVTVNSSGGGGCDLVLQYKTSDNTQSSATDNHVRPHFKINNDGNTLIDLSDVTIRYWYTKEGTSNQTIHVDWAQVGKQNVLTSMVQMATPEPGADHYMEVGFTAAAGSISAGGTSGPVQTCFHKSNWSNYDEMDDYSFNMNYNTFQNWDNVTLYCNGDLAWGTEPGGTQQSILSPGGNTSTFSVASNISSRALNGYPNPFSGKLIVETDASEILVFNALGKLVKKATTSGQYGQVEIDLTNKPNGVYFIKAGGQTANVVKQ